MRAQLCIRKLSVLQKRNVDLGGKKAASHQRKQAISLETARAQAFVIPFSSSYPLSLPWLAQTVPQPLLPLPKGALVNHRRAAQASSPLGDPSCGCAALGKAEGQRGAPMGPPLFCATAQQRLGGTPPGTVPGQENNTQTCAALVPTALSSRFWATSSCRFCLPLFLSSHLVDLLAGGQELRVSSAALFPPGRHSTSGQCPFCRDRGRASSIKHGLFLQHGCCMLGSRNRL